LVSEQKFEVPTWNHIYNMLIELADKVRTNHFKPDILVGISRGGWLPTRILSDLLENPCITSVGAEFYVGIYKTKSKPRLTQPLSVSVLNKKILLVDDVVDTGKSALLIKSHLVGKGAKETKLLTLYYKPWSTVKPDFYSKETSDWIVFPWEIKETLKKLVEKCKQNPELIAEIKSRLVIAGVPEELIERFIKEIF
jgi:hypoxanthine phosphoribosyltransferase